MKKEEVLYKYFKYKSFINNQDVVIDSILNHRDTIAIIPTGGGKSVIYQVPALMFSGVTIVISPLLSLMLDQVNNLIKKGINACYINSLLDTEKKNEIINNLEEYKIIYISPERFNDKLFIDKIYKLDVSLFAVDEAHTILWGLDFRSDFLKIKDYILKFKNRPVVLALTATATKKTISFIKKSLDLIDPFIYQRSVDRKNLYFSIIKPKNKDEFLINYLNEHKSLSGIIYTLTQKNVFRISKMLNEIGLDATYFHGGLDPKTKLKNQILFLDKKVNIMVSTISFGMGIDMHDIRYVINYELPQSMEDFVQMAGRCSRDGLYGECLVLYSKKDLKITEFLIDSNASNIGFLEGIKQRQYKMSKLDGMIGLAYSKMCIHKAIGNYFNENIKNCNNMCSNCKKKDEF